MDIQQLLQSEVCLQDGSEFWNEQAFFEVLCCWTALCHVAVSALRKLRDNVFPFGINRLFTPDMPGPKRKTEATTLTMTPELRELWERCAASERGSLTPLSTTLNRACPRPPQLLRAHKTVGYTPLRILPIHYVMSKVPSLTPRANLLQPFQRMCAAGEPVHLRELF